MKVYNKAIEFIAAFLPCGDIKPIKFRMNDKDDSEKVYEIKTIMKREELKFTGKHFIVFTCIVVNKVEKIAEIRFCKETMTWILWKM